MSQTPAPLGGGMPSGHCCRDDGCPGSEELVQPLGKRVEDERYGVAHSLHRQSWPLEGGAIAPTMLGEEGSPPAVPGAC